MNNIFSIQDVLRNGSKKATIHAHFAAKQFTMKVPELLELEPILDNSLSLLQIKLANLSATSKPVIRNRLLILVSSVVNLLREGSELIRLQTIADKILPPITTMYIDFHIKYLTE